MTDAEARLLRPRPALAGLIFAAFARDTRGAAIPPGGAFNVFPASPFCVVTFVRAGRLWRVGADGERIPLPPAFVSGPFRSALTSWSDAPVCALSVALYPDAWTRLTGAAAAGLRERHTPLAKVLRAPLHDAFAAALAGPDFGAGFGSMQDALAPLWRERRPALPSLRHWLDALGAAAATVGARQAQRRWRAASGQTQRELAAHARFERLLARAARGGSLAEIAADAGYADQSHMGRELRRRAGASPARMRGLIASDPRYWVFRLLGTQGESP